MTNDPKEHKEAKTGKGSSFELILFNDDYHDFDFVIEKLKIHCNHTDEQAEQCAIITHHRGECSVMLGSEERIEAAGKSLAHEGLTVDTRKVTV